MSGAVYAVARCGEPLAARLARAVQRDAAETLLRSISVGLHAPLIASKAHSRTLVAATAAQRRDGAALGIDIEYVDESRPMRQILRMLPEGDVAGERLTARAFYRGWTFAEAHYKALGVFPGPGLLHEAVHAERVRMIGDKLFVHHEDIDQDFVLCLVWRGLGGPPRRV